MMIFPQVRSFIVSTFLLFLFQFSLSAQPLHQGQWKTYTAMSGITDLAVERSSGNVWAATSGGAFRFSPSLISKDNILALRNSDGLSDNDLTAVAADSSGRIFFGGSSGTIDVYTESSGTLHAIREIALATQYARRKIHQISIFGTRVYIAAEFGLSIYDQTQNVFSETITKFATLTEQDTVFAATESGDSIYTVLSSAIAIAAKNAPILHDPAAWRIVAAPAGATLKSIVAFAGKIIVGEPEGIYQLEGDGLHYIST